ncbi:MAG: serine/threonine-protein kinase, partial [Polyangiales bacterium]
MAETKSCTSCGRRYDDGAIFCPKDGSALLPISAIGARSIEAGKDPLVGRVILGQFEIRALIGAGAMGRVYRAHQQGMDRDVAVKILHKDLAQNSDIVARFLREAKVASKLVHPHLVNVLLAGQLEDGTMYLVMEHLDGVSLQSALMAAGGMLSVPRAMHIGVQICDAIGEAHQAGIIHRDVKPENVMLIRRGDDDDFVKVLDFGVARLGAREAGAIETQAGLVFGTARYLSPEGARGEPAGPASDVYAIATVIYQCLAGRTPFEHESAVSLLVAQIHDAPPPIRAHSRGASTPAPIERAIMHNLAKDSGRRDVDAHAFGQALLHAAGESGLSVDDLIARPSMARRKSAPSGATPMPRPVSMAEIAASTPGFAQPVRLDRTADDLPSPTQS